MNRQTTPIIPQTLSSIHRISVSQEPHISHSPNTHYGLPLEEYKEDNHTRISSLNINGLALSNTGGKLQSVLLHTHEYNIDIFALQETQIDTHFSTFIKTVPYCIIQYKKRTINKPIINSLLPPTITKSLALLGKPTPKTTNQLIEKPNQKLIINTIATSISFLHRAKKISYGPSPSQPKSTNQNQLILIPALLLPIKIQKGVS